MKDHKELAHLRHVHSGMVSISVVVGLVFKRPHPSKCPQHDLLVDKNAKSAIDNFKYKKTYQRIEEDFLSKSYEQLNLIICYYHERQL